MASKKKKTKIFYAAAQFYEPFIIGGDVWQWYRYPVEARLVKIVDFDCFIFEGHNGDYHIHEQKTGGLIGKGKTKKRAEADAIANVKSTPDLKKQMAQFGDVMSFKETTKKEAFRRLQRGTQ